MDYAESHKHFLVMLGERLDDKQALFLAYLLYGFPLTLIAIRLDADADLMDSLAYSIVEKSRVLRTELFHQQDTDLRLRDDRTRFISGSDY